MIQPQSRREFLTKNAMGVGGMALACLLQQEKLLATPANIPRGPVSFDTKPKTPPLAPRATAMISLFMHGGPSHMDLTDPKPELSKHSGTEYSGDVGFSFVNRATKTLFGSCDSRLTPCWIETRFRPASGNWSSPARSP